MFHAGLTVSTLDVHSPVSDTQVINHTNCCQVLHTLLSDPHNSIHSGVYRKSVRVNSLQLSLAPMKTCDKLVISKDKVRIRYSLPLLQVCCHASFALVTNEPAQVMQWLHSKYSKHNHLHLWQQQENSILT